MSIRSSIGSRRISSGSHVLERARPVARAAEGRRVGDGQAEVDQLDAVVASEQEVPRIDVVVDESGRMDRGQPLGGLGQPFDLLRRAPRLRVVDVLEADPVDELHHQVVLVVVRVPVLERTDHVGADHLDAISPSGGRAASREARAAAAAFFSRN